MPTNTSEIGKTVTQRSGGKEGCDVPLALLRPSRLRWLSLPLILLACLASVFFKARAAEAFPWDALLLVGLIVGGSFAAETLLSTFSAESLAPAVGGFLAGVGVNAGFQALVNRFQGLTWAFQSSIQWSLGTVLFGFLGTMIFLRNSSEVNRIFRSGLGQKTAGRVSSRVFSGITWGVTAASALALCVTLWVIQKEYGEFETANPLRQPLWFSLGAGFSVFVLVLLVRRNMRRLGLIFIPGVIFGLAWAAVIRTVFEGVYIAWTEFPLAPETLEVVLILNLCYMGVAWLNRAAIKLSA